MTWVPYSYVAGVYMPAGAHGPGPVIQGLPQPEAHHGHEATGPHERPAAAAGAPGQRQPGALCAARGSQRLPGAAALQQLHALHGAADLQAAEAAAGAVGEGGALRAPADAHGRGPRTGDEPHEVRGGAAGAAGAHRLRRRGAFGGPTGTEGDAFELWCAGRLEDLPGGFDAQLRFRRGSAV